MTHKEENDYEEEEGDEEEDEVLVDVRNASQNIEDFYEDDFEVDTNEELLSVDISAILTKNEEEEISNEEDIAIQQEKLIKRWVGREKEIRRIISHIERKERIPIFITGERNTGKTSITRSILQSTRKNDYCWIKVMEGSTQKEIFEDILFSLLKSQKTPPCSSSSEFSFLLEQILQFRRDNGNDKILFLVFDNAEALISKGLIPYFVQLEKIVPKWNVRVIFISSILNHVWATTWSRLSFLPFQIHFHKYPKEDIQNILKQQLSLEEEGDLFVSLIYDSVCTITTDLIEMIFIAQTIWQKIHERNDENKLKGGELIKRIKPFVTKESLDQIFTREFGNNSFQKSGTMNQLPKIARFLLVASYLASHVPPELDRQLFTTYESRGKGRRKPAPKNIINESQHPKIFTRDRMIAIFSKISEYPHQHTSFLYSHIATLVKQLRLIEEMTPLSDLRKCKLRCSVDYETIRDVSLSLKLDISQYLVT